MTTSAIVLMIIGMLIIWGGLAASIIYAVSTSRAKKRGGDNRNSFDDTDDAPKLKTNS
ncbi:MAG TPA: methionine/alanine import family NSS transporter small subunit [Planococcus sp. (in: firmicutes)]|nr:methionine/alanine import family NSS transporter small subunit [Planococcus sp. (in: firmicutes)]